MVIQKTYNDLEDRQNCLRSGFNSIYSVKIYHKFHYHALGVLVKLRKVTINFVVSVRLSSWNNSASAVRIFMKFDI
jgi:aryl carrier-like protein